MLLGYKEILALVASILAIVGNISYIKDIFKGKVHPHPYTWFVWSIVSLVTFFGVYEKGGGVGAIPIGVSESFTIIIFLFSLKHLFGKQEWHFRTVDHYFFAASLLGLIPWYLTKDPTISVIVVVMIDVIAFIPTLEKTWHHPKTEQPFLFETNATRHVLTLLALESYNVATMFHSVAMILTNTLMAIFIKKLAGNGKKEEQ